MTLLTMLLRGALPLVPLVFIVLFVTLTILNRVLRCQDPDHADLQLHQSVHGQQNVQVNRVVLLAWTREARGQHARMLRAYSQQRLRMS